MNTTTGDKVRVFATTLRLITETYEDQIKQAAQSGGTMINFMPPFLLRVFPLREGPEDAIFCGQAVEKEPELAISLLAKVANEIEAAADTMPEVFEDGLGDYHFPTDGTQPFSATVSGREVSLLFTAERGPGGPTALTLYSRDAR